MQLFTDTIQDTIQAELHADGLLEISAGDNLLAQVGDVNIRDARDVLRTILGVVGNEIPIKSMIPYM